MGQDDCSVGGEQGEGKSKGFSITKIFRPVTSVNTSIGMIYMYRLRASDHTNLKNLSESDSIPEFEHSFPTLRA